MRKDEKVVEKNVNTAEISVEKAETDPWTTMDVRVAFETPWIRVEDHRVLNPVGRSCSYGVVRFKNVAVGVLPIDGEGCTYLVGQWRYPLGRYSWEIPEGGCPLGEDPQAAARRELREETGLEASRWETLFEVDMSNSVTDERAVVFLARELQLGKSEPEETEVLKVRRVPLREAFAMVHRGEIRDSLSVSALLRAELMQLANCLP